MTNEELKTILEAHEKWLVNQKNGKRAKLRYADLRGADLSGADLSGANLDDADLWKTKLSGAKNIKWASKN